jgi:hypothetical protein
MIRIAFSDHYEFFVPEKSRVYRSLAAVTDVVVCDITDSPDLLVYGDFGEAHWAFHGLKLYLTGENMTPDFEQCDLAFTPFETPGDPRAIRLPYYAQVLESPTPLLERAKVSPRSGLAAGFCSFVVSNPRSWPRNRFFKKLLRRRRVDSGGSLFNNMGGRVADKMKFVSDYRFNIAFENTETDGYITEKLVEPLLAGTIPIYWGAPDVLRDFDARCFVHARDFEDLDALADFVIALDSDPKRQLEYLNAPVFQGGVPPPCLSDAYVADPILNLLKNGQPGRRRYRRRRIREHVYLGRSWFANKWERFSCKFEAQAWKLGWRF